MTTFIKSSMRTRPDPGYYKKIADRLAEKRDILFVEIEALETSTGKEAKDLRNKAAKIDAKVKWALIQLPVAMRMRDAIKKE